MFRTYGGPNNYNGNHKTRGDDGGLQTEMKGKWRYHTASEHPQMDYILRITTLNMMSDRIRILIGLEKPYQVNFVDRREWNNRVQRGGTNS